MTYVDTSQRDLDKLFNDYNIQESIDTLHKVVNDAKERKSRGEDGKDAWKDNLDPRWQSARVPSHFSIQRPKDCAN